MGSTRRAPRTLEQTEIGLFWVESSPLAWNRIARSLAARARLTLWEGARLFGLLNLALADGYIGSWESKYHYKFWRPVTAIQLGDSDDNPATVGDPNWTPLVLTYPMPDHDSAHSVEGGAAAEVLKRFFGTDKVHFTACSRTLPAGSKCTDASPVRRSFRSFSEAADENGLSRILVGIHFRRAVDEGIQHGRKIGARGSITSCGRCGKRSIAASSRAVPPPTGGGRLRIVIGLAGHEAVQTEALVQLVPPHTQVGLDELREEALLAVVDVIPIQAVVQGEDVAVVDQHPLPRLVRGNFGQRCRGPGGVQRRVRPQADVRHRAQAGQTLSELLVSEGPISVIGPLARSADDLALALKVTAGPDLEDGYRLALPAPPTSLSGLRVAVWLDQPDLSPVDAAVMGPIEDAARALEKAGATIDFHARPKFDVGQAHATYLQLLLATMSARDPEYDRLLGGPSASNPPTAVSTPRSLRFSTARHREFVIAAETRDLHRWAWRAFFQDHDVLLAPITATPPFPHDHSEPMPARTMTVNGTDVRTSRSSSGPASPSAPTSRPPPRPSARRPMASPSACRSSATPTATAPRSGPPPSSPSTPAASRPRPDIDHRAHGVSPVIGVVVVSVSVVGVVAAGPEADEGAQLVEPAD